jgi:hypothetical protein
MSPQSQARGPMPRISPSSTTPERPTEGLTNEQGDPMSPCISIATAQTPIPVVVQQGMAAPSSSTTPPSPHLSRTSPLTPMHATTGTATIALQGTNASADGHMHDGDQTRGTRDKGGEVRNGAGGSGSQVRFPTACRFPCPHLCKRELLASSPHDTSTARRDSADSTQPRWHTPMTNRQLLRHLTVPRTPYMRPPPRLGRERGCERPYAHGGGDGLDGLRGGYPHLASPQGEYMSSRVDTPTLSANGVNTRGPHPRLARQPHTPVVWVPQPRVRLRWLDGRHGNHNPPRDPRTSSIPEPTPTRSPSLHAVPQGAYVRTRRW